MPGQVKKENKKMRLIQLKYFCHTKMHAILMKTVFNGKVKGNRLMG